MILILRNKRDGEDGGIYGIYVRVWRSGRAGDRQDPSDSAILIGLVLGLSLFRELVCRTDIDVECEHWETGNTPVAQWHSGSSPD